IVIASPNSYYVMGQGWINFGTSWNDTLCIMNLDSSGNMIWSKAYGIPNVYYNTGFDMLLGSGNNIAISGYRGVHHHGGISGYDSTGVLLYDNSWNLDGMSGTPGGYIEDM